MRFVGEHLLCRSAATGNRRPAFARTSTPSALASATNRSRMSRLPVRGRPVRRRASTCSTGLDVGGDARDEKMVSSPCVWAASQMARQSASRLEGVELDFRPRGRGWRDRGRPGPCETAAWGEGYLLPAIVNRVANQAFSIPTETAGTGRKDEGGGSPTVCLLARGRARFIMLVSPKDHSRRLPSMNVKPPPALLPRRSGDWSATEAAAGTARAAGSQAHGRSNRRRPDLPSVGLGTGEAAVFRRHFGRGTWSACG